MIRPQIPTLCLAGLTACNLFGPDAHYSCASDQDCPQEQVCCQAFCETSCVSPTHTSAGSTGSTGKASVNSSATGSPGPAGETNTGGGTTASAPQSSSAGGTAGSTNGTVSGTTGGPSSSGGTAVGSTVGGASADDGGPGDAGDGTTGAPEGRSTGEDGSTTGSSSTGGSSSSGGSSTGGNSSSGGSSTGGGECSPCTEQKDCQDGYVCSEEGTEGTPYCYLSCTSSCPESGENCNFDDVCVPNTGTCTGWGTSTGSSDGGGECAPCSSKSDCQKGYDCTVAAADDSNDQSYCYLDCSAGDGYCPGDELCADQGPYTVCVPDYTDTCGTD
ncbi:MAG TPA: hypothetical protein VMB50_14345 [Myxococcales bacterium]|nr:hypothetical protein [Myxococcales bacterium]